MRISPRVGRFAVAAVLLVLVLAGGALRFLDLNWDHFQHAHPDERWIVWVADTMTWPERGWAAALDPQVSPLNPLRWPPGGERAGEPRNYAYGHFPLYLLVVTANAAAGFARWFGDTSIAFPQSLAPIYTVGRHLNEYGYMTIVARALSALADLAALLIVFAMTTRLARGETHSRHRASVAGLLAATAYAFAVLPIQLSHYGAVDALLTFCITATVALASRYAEQGGRWTWALAGVMTGLAVGSKFSAVLLAIPLLVAAAYAPVRQVDPALARGSELARFAVRILRRVAGVGALAVLTFVVTNPFALLEARQYISVIASQNTMVNGVMDAPYTRQYIGTIPYWYFIQQLSQWGLGWPLGIAAWAGLVWALVRFAQRHVSPALVVALAWAFPYFATTGAFHTKYLRYMAPLLPFLLAFAATAAVALWAWVSQRGGRRGGLAWGVAVGGVLAFGFIWALTFTGIYRQEHPWIRASLWLYENAPEGSKILSEAWDDALPLTLDEYPDRPPIRRYTRVELPLWEVDDVKKLDTLAQELADADFLVLASNRLYAPIQRLAWRYPLASQYYRMLFAGELGYEPVAEFTVYPRLGALVVPDDHADESFTVYDHPRVIVFRNVAGHSASTLRTLLGRYLPGSGDQLPEQHTTGRPPGLALIRPQAITPAAVTSAAETPGAGSPGVGTPDAGSPALVTPGAPFMLDRPVDTLPVVADYRWNAWASASPVAAAVLWWLVISVFGWAVWPLLFPLLGGLRDRGFGLARAVGWLAVGWVHWSGVSLGGWQNRTGALAILLGLLILAGGVSTRVRWHQLACFWRERRRLLLIEEALFASAFLLFTGIRLLNPDLWQPWNGGEKFMEFAFLNAILRSPTFPPFDPYFAGGIINYYYYGLYLVTLPIKLTGIFAEVAFNLAVPALYALTAVGVFSVAASLRPSLRLPEDDLTALLPDAAAAGKTPPMTARASGGEADARPGPQAWLAVLLTLVIGNLRGLPWLWEATRRLVRGDGLPAYDYWAASRVIPFTINEFPLWTFVFADLHPHLIAMPFGILVVGLALNWLRSARLTVLQGGLNTALLVLALGALGPLNTWDLPVYALLMGGVLCLAGWQRGKFAGLGTGILTAAGVFALAIAAYLPFYRHYRAMVPGKLGILSAGSPLDGWLWVWGFFLFLALGYAVYTFIGAWRSGAEPGAHRGRRWLFGVLIMVAADAVLLALGRPTAALAVTPMLLLLPVIFGRSASEVKFAALVLTLGLAILAGTELVYLRDFLDGGEWRRMNTVFKFSVSAWLLLGLAGGVALERLWRASYRLPVALGVLWQAGAVIMLLGGLVFAVFGIRARVEDRFPGARPRLGTLDGLAYMSVGQYSWAETTFDLGGDHQAIRWLLDHVTGTPVIAEAPAGHYEVAGEPVGYDYYRAGGLRVASMTGLPTFVGHHQNEQRPGDQVSMRTVQAQTFYQTTDLAVARRLIRDLRIGYVYVGSLERVLFDAAGLRKFDVLVELGDFEVAYQNADVTIYRALR